MVGGFIAFRCSDFENTAEREQFRTLCKMLKKKFEKSDKMCFLIANYNIFDSEFDAILIKNDAIMAIEFKNYGGNIVAVENGEWTSNGTIIRGGSRKTVYQQARINHASLRNGLKELGVNSDWIKNLPSLIVFNKLITLENNLSNKVQSWLHITDNAHFIEKVEDITSKETNMSNTDMIDLAIKLNLNSFVDQKLSAFTVPEKKEQKDDLITYNINSSQESTEYNSKSPVSSSYDSSFLNILQDYDRYTPNHIFSLRPNQIFVFGTDKRGSQKYGAAGLAANKFGAQVGVTEGQTGRCYALPTKGFTLEDLKIATERFLQYIDANPQFTYLITPVGCGHAGFNTADVALLFKKLVEYKNVMLPKSFIDEIIIAESNNEDSKDTEELQMAAMPNKKDEFAKLKIILNHNQKSFNEEGTFVLKDENGTIIAEAEIGLYEDKVVFSPLNIQSSMIFKNNGYIITTPEEYLSTNK